MLVCFGAYCFGQIVPLASQETIPLLVLSPQAEISQIASALVRYRCPCTAHVIRWRYLWVGTGGKADDHASLLEPDRKSKSYCWLGQLRFFWAKRHYNAAWCCWRGFDPAKEAPGNLGHSVAKGLASSDLDGLWSGGCLSNGDGKTKGRGLLTCLIQ